MGSTCVCDDQVMNEIPGSAETGASLSQLERSLGRANANAEDASLWHWFAGMMEQSRIRWRSGTGRWLVSLDHKHLSTECDFDCAVRAAKAASECGAMVHPMHWRRSDAKDAAVWRWFSLFVGESLIRWHRMRDGWLAIVNHRRLSTEPTFALAIESAKVAWEARRLPVTVERRTRTVAPHSRGENGSAAVRLGTGNQSTRQRA